MLTKECISVAFVNHNEEIDRIPLAGIEYLKKSEEVNAMDIELELSHEHFCLQITTDPESHNSGRSYYMRTSSKEEYDSFFLSLTKFTKTARKKAQASTVFQKAQLRVRKTYGRFECQCIFALIIIGVS